MTEKEPPPTIAQNPWPVVKEARLNKAVVDTHFDDNFTQLKEESNENGLQLPESEHYLAVLERKLMRIQSKQNGKEDASDRAQVKDILKSLNAKRDALFQHDLPITSGADLNELALTSNEAVEKSQMQAISSLITNTALYSVIEKKIAPQSQALDAEEVKKLLDADLLNLIKESESENNISLSKDTAKHDTK